MSDFGSDYSTADTTETINLDDIATGDADLDKVGVATDDDYQDSSVSTALNTEEPLGIRRPKKVVIKARIL